jgi:hypothetical protein
MSSVRVLAKVKLLETKLIQFGGMQSKAALL